MSTLLIDQLFSGVVFPQPIKVSRDVSVVHIRPWVYIQGPLASGDFQCRVLQGGTVLAVSTINYVDINAALTENYANGKLRFDFESLILHRAEGEEDTEYIFEFSMINHTTNPTNFLAIVREWDLKSTIVYGDVDGSGAAVNDAIEPAGYEIFEYRSH